MQNRLPALSETGKQKDFCGRGIDRTKALTFRLDGYEISAFAGDTVLSAALSSGITGAGFHSDNPIALSEQFAPQIIAHYPDGTTSEPLDMARTPVQADMNLRCIGALQHSAPRRFAEKLSGKKHNNLQVNFDTTRLSPLHARFIKSWETENVDAVIVGGGISGMAAAVALGEADQTVVLIERRMCLGGDAELFGNRDGERPAAEMIAELNEKLNALSNVDVRLLCDAAEAYDGHIVTHTIVELGQKHKTVVRNLKAKHIILATGCSDRMPVFGGNRLPGVVGLASSFYFAKTFGVWPSGDTLIAGNTNCIYRLGLSARDVDSSILQIADTRLSPNSRFRDFAKAYGLKLASGTQVRSVERNNDVAKLKVQLGLSWEDDLATGGAMLECDQLIVSQGWVPRLSLWKQLGGQIKWHKEKLNIHKCDVLENVQCIGSAAGYTTASACLQSGVASAEKTVSGQQSSVSESLIDDIFESSDGLPARVIPADGKNPAYLEAKSFSIVQDDKKEASPFKSFFKRRIEIEPGTPGDRALSLLDIEALIRLNLLDERALSEVLTERMISPLPLVALNTHELSKSQSTGTSIPAYLVGRFGDDPKTCEISTPDSRQHAAGSLIYATSDELMPGDAIGCILHSKNGKTIGLVDEKFSALDAHIFIAEIQRITPATISAHHTD